MEDHHASGSLSRSATSRSTRSSDSFALSPDEASIVSCIVQRTNPGDSTFRDLTPHYSAVLQDLGTDERADETIYPLLLKLSLVPGKDWKAKWQGFLKDHEIGNRPADSRDVHLEHRRIISPRDVQSRNAGVPLLPASARPTKTSADERASPLSSPTRPSHPQMHDPLHLSASRHDKLRRLNHCLQRWRARLEHTSTRRAEARRWRSDGLLKAVSHQWIRRCADLRTITDASVRLAALSAKDRSLARWRWALDRRREVRWHNHAQTLVSAYRAKRDARLIGNVLQRWYQPTIAGLLSRHRDAELLRILLAHWRRRLLRNLRLKQLARDFSRARGLRLQANVADVWMTTVYNIVALRRFRASRTLRYGVRTVDLWRNLAQESHTIRAFAASKLSGRMLLHWIAHIRCAHAQQLLGRKLLDNKDAALAQKTFSCWIRAARTKIFTTQVVDRRTHRALRFWEGRAKHLGNISERAARHHDDRAKRMFFRRWLDRLHIQMRQTEFAVALRDCRCMSKASIIVKLRVGEYSTRHQKSNLARVLGLLVRSWAGWRAEVLAVRSARWEEAHSTKTVRAVLRGWLARLQDRRRLSASYVQIGHLRNEHLAAHVLRRWYISYTKERQAVLVADARRSAALISSTGERFKEQAQLVREREVSVDALIQQTERRRTLRITAWWKSQALRARRLRMSLGAFASAKAAARLNTAWLCWRDGVLESRLSGKVLSFQHQTDDDTIRRRLEYWAEHSATLVMLRRRRQHLAIGAARHWRLATAVKRLRVIAESADARKLRVEALNVWRRRVQARRANRISSRFRLS